MQLLMYHIRLRSATISQNFPHFEQYFLMPFFAGDSCKVNKCSIGAGGGFAGGAAGKSVQIRRRSRPWLPLWGSCRANARLRGCTQWQIWEKYRDCYMVPSQSRLRRASSPIGRAKGRALPARLFPRRGNNVGALRRQCGISNILRGNSAGGDIYTKK